jgi:putative ABC transport system substrate-binding protein
MFGRMIHTVTVLRARRANAGWGGIWVVALSLVVFGSSGMAAHAQGAPVAPIGTPIVPIAYDGRTLYYETFATQATFKTVWGERAEARWVEEHNAELAQGRPLSGPRIAYLSSNSASGQSGRDALIAGLREQGYIPGQTIAIEWRYTEGQIDANVLDAVAAEIIGLRPDLIISVATPETLALMKATSTIPIVFTSLADPVGAGAVPSLERPGGNLTGLNNTPPQLQAQRLAFLKEAVPGATRIGVLRNTSNPASAGPMQQLRDAADSAGLQIQELAVTQVPEDLAPAFDLATQARVEAVIEISDPQLGVNRERINELATQTRLPVLAANASVVNGQPGGGALMAASPEPSETARRAAVCVSKILGGAKPGDLSVGFPQTVDFVINLRAAQAIGFTFAATIVTKATDVVR